MDWEYEMFALSIVKLKSVKRDFIIDDFEILQPTSGLGAGLNQLKRPRRRAVLRYNFIDQRGEHAEGLRQTRCCTQPVLTFDFHICLKTCYNHRFNESVKEEYPKRKKQEASRQFQVCDGFVSN